MAQPYTYAGATIAICVTAQNADLANAAAFAALTYVNIGNVGNIGEYGYNTNMVNYPTMDRALILKAKGQTDGGSLSVECAQDDDDLGQAAMITAADPQSQDNFAFEITLPTGAIDYVRGPVGGPTHPASGNEDFRRSVFTIGVNQIINVPAP